VSLYHKRER